MLVIIIGAGAGISQSVAELFGQKGFKIALISRSEEKLNTQVATLTAAGVDAVYALGDAGDEASLTHAIEGIILHYGEPDLILYNAFTFNMKPIASETWETVKAQLDVNVGGAFHVLKMFVPKFKARNSGKIFITGGGLALQPMMRILALGIGKAAMRNMVLAVAQEARNTTVHIATLTVSGFVKPEDPKNSPKLIAEQYWRLYEQQPGQYETEVVY